MIGVVAADPDGMERALELIDARHRVLTVSRIPVEWQRETLGFLATFRPSERPRYDGEFCDVCRWPLTE